MDLVKFGGIPSTVPLELIELIQSQIDDECVIDLVKLPNLEAGSNVRIAEGPLRV